MIRIQTIDTEMPDLPQQEVKDWLCDVAASYNKKVGELYYLFCSDDYLYKMNVDKLGHDFLTDIITFPLNDCEIFLSGEFYISIDRIRDNAGIFGKTFTDELHRVMAHGLLHLCGFKDKSDDEAAVMRLQEEKALSMRDNWL